MLHFYYLVAYLDEIYYEHCCSGCSVARAFWKLINYVYIYVYMYILILNIVNWMSMGF